VTILLPFNPMTERANVIKVAIIGPECTGKSELSAFLAQHYRTTWVPEYARGYLEHLTVPYQLHDLTTIAHGQLRLEDEYAHDANTLLFCDTNLYVIKVWSEFKFGTCDPEILKLLNVRKYDFYLLTNIDIPWQEDPQREHPHKRQQLYDIYLNEMKNQPVPFVEIAGDRESRRKQAQDAIEKLLVKTN
jgi:NadR type nicotinamide-nucleotide adenylyltransferase